MTREYITGSTHRPDLIVSGGQSGADTGGLLAAQVLNIATGGYAPAGFRTESGSRPELGTLYGLIEAPLPDYASRTALNIAMSDAVLIIARRFESAGTKLTKRLAFGAAKPCFDVVFPTHAAVERPETVQEVRDWLNWHKPCVLMVAGNRESVAKGLEEWSRQFILAVFA